MIERVVTAPVTASAVVSATVHAPQPPSPHATFVDRHGVLKRMNSASVVVGVKKVSPPAVGLTVNGLPLIENETEGCAIVRFSSKSVGFFAD